MLYNVIQAVCNAVLQSEVIGGNAIQVPERHYEKNAFIASGLGRNQGTKTMADVTAVESLLERGG